MTRNLIPDELLLCSISACYVGSHFLIYVLAGRLAEKLRTESGIFLWHAVSYLLQLAILYWAAMHWSLPALLPALVFAAALHGLYSLSFLELWSLTQGSYSLGILAHLEKAGGHATANELGRLQAVGLTKQSSRRANLDRLGLVRSDAGLTFFGRMVTWPLRVILWLSNGHTMN